MAHPRCEASALSRHSCRFHLTAIPALWRNSGYVFAAQAMHHPVALTCLPGKMLHGPCVESVLP